MKLLLTSSGLTKRQIGKTLQGMVGMSPSECKIAFIPTAANVETSNKDWVISQFGQMQRYGFYQIDIVDISADGVDWKSRLSSCDVIWVAGGNTFHLLDQVRKTGFDVWLKDNINNKVYVGGSASTILMTPSVAIAEFEDQDENITGLEDLTGLDYVDFEIQVHCNANRFETIKQYAAQSSYPVYALDDLSAIKVVDGDVEVVSGGTWKYFTNEDQ